THLHHRYLLSFPTRRSSDLCWMNSLNLWRRGIGISFPLTCLTLTVFSGRRKSALMSVSRAPSKEFLAYGNWLRSVLSDPIKISGDRKSTRLNSSHRTISYAV